MKKVFTILITLVVTTLAVAQTGDFRKDFEEANLLFEEKFYKKSLDIWLALDEMDPDNANVNYKIGLCYLELNTEKLKALPYFGKASLDVDKNWMPWESSERSAPSTVWYYLAKCYHLNSEFDKAIETYGVFQEEVKKKHFLYDDSFRQIEMCKTAKNLIENPVDINIINLGENINGPYSDFSPVLSIDETIMYFTSRRLRADSTNEAYFDDADGKHFEDIYVSYKDENGDWGPAERLEFKFYDGSDERQLHEATISTSIDGQTLFIYKDDKGDGNIYMSQMSGDIWVNPSKMEGDISTKAWETHITMSGDGHTLYFVSDREGGLGGRDIYRCVRLPNGEWSKALNLGAPINTEQDEDAPYLMPDGVTMYFSSNAHHSMGGFDIFRTVLDEETGIWSEPMNMGYPINSVDDDVFFTLSADGQRAYFASASEDGYGEKDIYMAELETPPVATHILRGMIVQEGGHIPDELTITLTDITTDEEFYGAPRSRDGKYFFTVEPCKTYIIEYQIEGDVIKEEEFEVPCVEQGYHEYDLATLYLDLEGNIVEHYETVSYMHWGINIDGVETDRTDLILKMTHDDGTVDILPYPYQLYDEIDTDKEYLVEVVADDISLCDQLEMILYDKNGNPVGKTVRDKYCNYIFNRLDGDPDTIDPDSIPDTDPDLITAEPVSYEKFYKYNVKDISLSEGEFQKFIKGIGLLVEANGEAVITIESSASKVPTKTYGTNDNLAQKRANDARDRILEGLTKYKIDATKVKILEIDTKVQGPEYNNDAYTNRKQYEPFQYVKIWAK